MQKIKSFGLKLSIWLSFPLALLLRTLGLRFLNVSCPRAIGHLCIEPALYIKRLYLKKEKPCKMILALPVKQLFSLFPKEAIVDNVALLQYWKKYFKVIKSPWLCLLLLPLIRSRILSYKPIKFLHSGAYIPLLADQRTKDPFLTISANHRQKGEKILRSWGIKKNDWYIVFHCREFGYRQDSQNEYRNSQAESLDQALQEIHKRGGWCIRLGKATNPLPEKLKKHNRLIDYSKSEFFSDWMDLFLIATSKLYLGSSNTGLNEVPFLFRTPMVLVNTFAFNCLPQTKSLFIPKLYFCKNKKSFLSFAEILQNKNLGLAMDKEQIDKLNIQIIDNSPKEIKEAVLEKLAQIEKKQTVEKNSLQKQFTDLFVNYYGQGSPALIGSRFINKYQHLVKQK